MIFYCSLREWERREGGEWDFRSGSDWRRPGPGGENWVKR